MICGILDTYSHFDIFIFHSFILHFSVRNSELPNIKDQNCTEVFPSNTQQHSHATEIAINNNEVDNSEKKEKSDTDALDNRDDSNHLNKVHNYSLPNYISPLGSIER